MKNTTVAESLAGKLEGLKGDLQKLTRSLDRRGERFLSFSKVTTVEFCQYRYQLEYVERVRLDPRPDYFVKGGLFHDAMARHYRERARGRRAKYETHCRFIDGHGGWRVFQVPVQATVPAGPVGVVLTAHPGAKQPFRSPFVSESPNPDRGLRKYCRDKPSGRPSL